jgi:hypothetical protein
MFALCENQTRDLLRSRRVFPPLRHIGRHVRITRKGERAQCGLSIIFLFKSKQLEIGSL